MHHDHDHADIIHGFYNEQKEIFDASSQAMYAFLDDENRVCNNQFAALLGYSSAEEWSTVDVHESFPNAFVAEKSQETLVEAYQKAMESGAGSTITVTWKKKSGGSVHTTVILIPILYQGHLLALHFVADK